MPSPVYKREKFFWNEKSLLVTDLRRQLPLSGCYVEKGGMTSKAGISTNKTQPTHADREKTLALPDSMR